MNSPSMNIPKLALTRDEAAAATGICVRTLDDLLADPALGFPHLRIGARVVIPLVSLENWLNERARERAELDPKPIREARSKKEASGAKDNAGDGATWASRGKPATDGRVN